MSQRIIQDGLIPQPALSRALQRRLSAPVADHGFDVVSDPPPLVRVEPVEDGQEKSAETTKHAE